jgi:predicted transposase YbfD/YdcC
VGQTDRKLLAVLSDKEKNGKKGGSFPMEEDASDFISHFSIIRDPRIERQKKHPLKTILFTAICAVTAGAEHWTEMEQFAREKQEWLSQYVDFPNGIPSHDTFGRVFAVLNPREFDKSFLSWVRSVHKKTQGEIIAIDGKTARRSHDRSNGKDPLHLVHAWSSENHLLLGQMETDTKSNEITAIPKLLKMLDLKGLTVTIDAMGCQKTIAKEISKQGGNYVFSLKGNQETIHEEVKLYWQDEQLKQEADHYETVEKGHGRIEKRNYWVTSDTAWMDAKPEWANLKSIGMVESERTIGEESSVERRCYLTSLGANAKEFARAVREHWGVENGLHYVLDISFREDECRVRRGHAAQNFALLRRLVLNLLKRDKEAKVGVKARRLKAGWSNAYLERVLFR